MCPLMLQQIPCKGDCMCAYICYEAKKFLNCGIFEVDELKYNTPPDTITVKGLATGIEKTFKANTNNINLRFKQSRRRMGV